MNEQQLESMIEGIIDDTKDSGVTECIVLTLIEKEGTTQKVTNSKGDQWLAFNRRRRDIAQQITSSAITFVQKAKKVAGTNELSVLELAFTLDANPSLFTYLSTAIQEALPEISDVAFDMNGAGVTQSLLRYPYMDDFSETNLERSYIYLLAWKSDVGGIYTHTCINLGHYLAVSLQRGKPDVFASKL